MMRLMGIRDNREQIDLAFRALHCGFHESHEPHQWQQGRCHCEPEVNAAPCRYCAIWCGLAVGHRYLKQGIPLKIDYEDGEAHPETRQARG
jgi:hypothetical protein